MRIEKLIIAWCGLCRTWYIECPVCGNNTCNGGAGEINGEKCIMCDEIYALRSSFGSRTNNKLDDLFDPIEKEEV